MSRWSWEYLLIKRARPYWDEFEGKVGEALAALRGGPMEVLELGCGDGMTTRVILDSRRDLRLTALDRDGKRLADAARNLKGAALLSRVRFARADAARFLERCPASRWDAVASKFTIHNFQENYRRKVLREIYRTLKPGGLFVNADKFALAGRAQRAALRRQLMRYFDVLIGAGRPDLFQEIIGHYLADETPGRKMEERGTLALMRRIGFRDLKRLFRKDLDAVWIAIR